MLLIFLCFPASLEAKEDTKVVLLIADRVNLTDWQQVSTPRLDDLLARGAVGLMNTKTAGSLEPKDTYLTIGSGQRATAGTAGYLNFKQREVYKGTTAENIYQRRIEKLEGASKVVNIGLPRIRRRNSQSDYQAEVGKLAALLEQADCQVAVLGNADTWQQPRRHIALLGINQQGVAVGDVSREMHRSAGDYPAGYLTNHEYLQRQFEKFYSESDLLVIEAGDTSRVEAVKNDLTTKRFNQAKRKAIKRTDRLLGQIEQEMNLATDYLMLVTPTPSRQGSQLGRKLTLALVVGPGIKKGLLTSATTKRSGLITNLDLAPTIYQLLTGFKSNLPGCRISSIAADKPLDYLAKQQEKIQTTFSWRPRLVDLFIWLQIIVLFGSGFVLIYRKNITFLKQIVITAVVSLLWLPIFFLLSENFLNYSLVEAGVIWLIVSFLLAATSINLCKNELWAIVLPAVITSGLLVFDLWGGSDWTKLSVFSYSPVIGARYYGLGNEFMGLLVGAFLIGITGSKELKPELPDWTFLVGLGLLTVTIGFPQLGANFGGLITAAVVSAVVYLSLRGVEFGYNFLLRIVFLAGVIILGVVIIEWFKFGGERGHLGRLLVRIKQKGINQLFLIISRKLKINLRLFKTTIWSRVLVAFMGILIVIYRWPSGKVRDLLSNYFYLAIGLKGALVGSIVTMLVNDSGVVAAATLLLFPVFSLLYIGLEHEDWKVGN